jgi:glutaredoxin-like YruB-family protein
MRSTMETSVTIYSTPTCTYCQKAKEFFSTNNVSYEEIDVSTNQQAKAEMIELSGQMGVPVIRIGTENVVVGFTGNEDLLKELLNLK